MWKKLNIYKQDPHLKGEEKRQQSEDVIISHLFG